MSQSYCIKEKNVLEDLAGEPHDRDKNYSFYCDYHMDGKNKTYAY